MLYRTLYFSPDEKNFVTYRGKCAMASPEADRYVVHLETTCGEAKHYCALFKQRDANVMEFQLGELVQQLFCCHFGNSRTLDVFFIFLAEESFFFGGFKGGTTD